MSPLLCHECGAPIWPDDDMTPRAWGPLCTICQPIEEEDEAVIVEKHRPYREITKDTPPELVCAGCGTRLRMVSATGLCGFCETESKMAA